MIVDICLWRLVFSGNQGVKHPPAPRPSDAPQVGDVCLFMLLIGLIKLRCRDLFNAISSFFLLPDEELVIGPDPKDFTLTPPSTDSSQTVFFPLFPGSQ